MSFHYILLFITITAFIISNSNNDAIHKERSLNATIRNNNMHTYNIYFIMIIAIVEVILEIAAVMKSSGSFHLKIYADSSICRNYTCKICMKTP